MSHTVFETDPSERSCGYCQFHGGFLRFTNIQNRRCIRKRCKWLILFTRHRDYEAFNLWEEDRVNRYRGDPLRFMELYGGLIALPKAKSESDEPTFEVPDYKEWKKDDKNKYLRNVRNGKATKPCNQRRRYKEKRSKRKERDDDEMAGVFEGQQGTRGARDRSGHDEV